tara:strand:- start:2542 stop:3285 length:744 start_codon:yes stop_codon:yes gene_type:complete
MPGPSPTEAEYQFYYWPEIPGRGEFVRLAFVAAGVPFREVIRQWSELASPMLSLGDQTLPRPPLAPPFLKLGDEIIGQTANILAFLGQRHGLSPDDAPSQRWVNQLQLSIMDWANEVHDTHHPVAPELYYEDQTTEALRRTAHYLKVRQPKYLAYFEQVIRLSGGPYLLGKQLSYADLSLMFTIEGLKFAFPRAMTATTGQIPHLLELSRSVLSLDNIQRYWHSAQRRPLKECMFRFYPELDALHPG